MFHVWLLVLALFVSYANAFPCDFRHSDYSMAFALIRNAPMATVETYRKDLWSAFGLAARAHDYANVDRIYCLLQIVEPFIDAERDRQIDEEERNIAEARRNIDARIERIKRQNEIGVLLDDSLDTDDLFPAGYLPPRDQNDKSTEWTPIQNGYSTNPSSTAEGGHADESPATAATAATAAGAAAAAAEDAAVAVAPTTAYTTAPATTATTTAALTTTPASAGVLSEAAAGAAVVVGGLVDAVVGGAVVVGTAIADAVGLWTTMAARMLA
jgi:hypothetical protein